MENNNKLCLWYYKITIILIKKKMKKL